MAIIFDHAVKYNGKYYSANTPVEEAPEKAETMEAEETIEAKAEAPKKAAKSRKKGDA